MKRINVLELLKDCPQGMELDCTICNGVKFIELDRNPNFPIVVRANNGYEFTLTRYGQVHNIDDAKCVIFPKGKTTWEGFVPPVEFKDGDIVFSGYNLISIFKGVKGGYNGSLHSYVSVRKGDSLINIDKDCWTLENIRFATEDEKQKLFQAIKDNGYKWNPETKTLERLIEPKFKVGDRIKNKNSGICDKVIKIFEDCYLVESCLFEQATIGFDIQDNWELIQDKFNVNTLKPFESRVLVRSTDDDIWRPAIYGFTNSGRYYVVGGACWRQCIPYEVNKELSGTTNNPKEYGSE